MIKNVYDSDSVSLRLNCRDSNSSLQLLTFEFLKLKYAFPPEVPFGEKMAAHLGLNVLHVLPKGPDWYQYVDVEKWLEVLRAEVCSSTLAFGSSMGGYAVARFSDLLGLDRGICFSPQFSIRRDKVPFERRWREHENRLDLSNEKDLKRDNLLWIFYDPFSDDRHHAHLIAETGRTSLIEVPYAGHPVGDALKECGILHEIQAMFVRGEESRWKILELISAVSRKSGTYYLNMGRARPLKERIEVWKMGLEVAPEHAGLRQHYGLFLLRNNKIEEANSILRPIIGRTAVSRLYKMTCEKYGFIPELISS